MTISAQVSTAELIKIQNLRYTGKRLVVVLCNDADLLLTPDSLVASWLATEIETANGYSRFTAEIPEGAYSAQNQRVEIGAVEGAGSYFDIEFTGSGIGFEFNTVVFIIQEYVNDSWVDPANPSAIYREFPGVFLAPVQTMRYLVQITLSK